MAATLSTRDAGDFDKVYLFHNDSELESADSLDKSKSDDETAFDLKEIIVDETEFQITRSTLIQTTSLWKRPRLDG